MALPISVLFLALFMAVSLVAMSFLLLEHANLVPLKNPGKP